MADALSLATALRAPMPNQAYVKPGDHVYNTPLQPQEEQAFLGWLAQNKVPFDAKAPVSDYDMRGFYRSLQAGDPRAASAIDPNDSQMHYPDYWKTPLHQTFSNESQWATPDAPHWTDDDKLVASDGRVVFDDRAQPSTPSAPTPNPLANALRAPPGQF